jgi:hypothetical protein
LPKDKAAAGLLRVLPNGWSGLHFLLFFQTEGVLDTAISLIDRTALCREWQRVNQKDTLSWTGNDSTIYAIRCRQLKAQHGDQGFSGIDLVKLNPSIRQLPASWHQNADAQANTWASTHLSCLLNATSVSKNEEKMPLSQTPSDQSSLSSEIIRLQARSDWLARRVTQKIVSAVDMKNMQSLLIETLSTHIQNNLVFQSLLGQVERHYDPDQVAAALFRYLDVDDADGATALLSEKGHQYIIDALSQTIKTLKLDQRISLAYGQALQHHGLFAPAPAHLANADRALAEDQQERQIEPEYKTEYFG